MKIDDVADNLSDYPDPRTAINNEDIPFEIIDFGIGRVVTEDPNNGDRILKFAVGHGIKQNKNEIKVTEIADSRGFKSLIAEVIDYGNDGYWIRLPKVDCPKSEEKKVTGPDSERIYSELESMGIIMYEIETGYMNGDPVAYDYGSVTDFDF